MPKAKSSISVFKSNTIAKISHFITLFNLYRAYRSVY